MPIELSPIVQSVAEAVGKSPLGTLSEVWQGLLGDRVAAWRIKNAAEIQQKLDMELKKRGLKTNLAKIPERYAITWFEEATKQDEPEIQGLFAKLLSNAAAGDEDALDQRNLETISKLTPHDAAVFKAMAEGKWGSRVSNGVRYWRDDRIFIRKDETPDIDHTKVSRSIEHLMSIGILGRLTQSEERYDRRSLTGERQIRTQIHNLVYLTETGRSIYQAVKDFDQ